MDSHFYPFAARFIVCFGNNENEYHTDNFKTFWGAKRCVEKWRGIYAHYRGWDQWAIYREVQQEWSKTCVIAQSKNWSHKQPFRNRSEADRWQPQQADTRQPGDGEADGESLT